MWREAGRSCWNFLVVYANRLYREHPEKPMDAAAFNIDRFHSLNDLYGREFGDTVLRTLGDEIQSFLDENGGIAGRNGADRFDIYCPRREDWQDWLNIKRISIILF